MRPTSSPPRRGSRARCALTTRRTRRHLTQAIVRIAESIGQLHGARVHVTISPGAPPVINTPAMAELAREAAYAVVGPQRVVNLRTANMGGEDFAHYLDHVSGCYVRFGGPTGGA